MLLPSDFHDIKTRYVRTRKMAFLSIARSAQTIKDSIRKISSRFNRNKFLKKKRKKIEIKIKMKIAHPYTKATDTNQIYTKDGSLSLLFFSMPK